jgi:hypothetical protein
MLAILLYNLALYARASLTLIEHIFVEKNDDLEKLAQANVALMQKDAVLEMTKKQLAEA